MTDPFAAPREDAPARPGPSLWSLVRFTMRRILLIGVIPFSVAVVGGSIGGLTAFFVAWLVPLLLWVPSTLVQLKVPALPAWAVC